MPYPQLFVAVTGHFNNGVFIMESRHRPLHEKHGAKMGKQDKTADAKATFLKTTRDYCDKIESGQIDMPEHIVEIPAGNGKYFRAFLIDENPSAAQA